MKPVDKHSVDSVFSARPEALDVARLRMKLQAAVRRISGLAQEKEQLIQMGNRLRAELARYTGKQVFKCTGRISMLVWLVGSPSNNHVSR